MEEQCFTRTEMDSHWKTEQRNDNDLNYVSERLLATLLRMDHGKWGKGGSQKASQEPTA